MNKSSKSAINADEILLDALKTAEDTGWNDGLIARLKEKFGLVAMTRHFPDGLSGLTHYFAKWADRQMLDAIEKSETFKDMKVRDKIAFGVRARLEILTPYKSVFKETVRYMMHPLRAFETKRLTWQTADRLWRAAGDNATDYNHYSKRFLLSGVLASTTLYFLKDTSENHEKTRTFLDRRIEDVMRFGKLVGKLKRAS